MTAKQLTDSILQLAIQGKLVPQNPDDEPASVLLDRIREEKKRLVKEGKLKKKDLIETPICEDEIPFDIPENWVWVHLGDVINLTSGRDLEPSKYNAAQKGIPYMTGASNFENGNLIINRWTDTPASISKLGDLLITCKGTIGEMADNEIGDIHIARQIMAIRPYFVHKPYLRIILKAKVAELEKKAKSIIPGFTREDLQFSLLPLPPFEEQKRIAIKFLELLSVIEEYGLAYEESTQLNSVLPEKLKKSILQEAIMGKLGTQDPNDEPASVLLDRIREEKKQLVKAGEIKLSKPEKTAKDSGEEFFKLPDKWTWCILNDICRVFGRIGFRGYTKGDLRDRMEDGAISISPSNMVNGIMEYTHCTFISNEKYEESPEIMINNGDILIVKTGSSYGKVSLVENLPWKSTINPQIAVIKDVKIDKRYLLYYLMTPFAQSFFKGFVLGTSIPTFSQLNLISIRFPLPPLAEQHRIVEKIEALFAEVDHIKI